MKMLNRKWLPVVIMGFMLVFSLLVFNNLPEQVPVKWSFSGEVVNTMPRSMAVLVLPLVTLSVWGVLQVAPRLDPRKESYEHFRETYVRFKVGIMLFMAVLHVIMLTQYENPTLMLRTVYLGGALLMAGIGNELGRIKPTWFVGIRTPWTLASENVWRKTHREGGRIFFWVSIMIAIGALILPLELAGQVFLVGIIGASLGIYVYSYILYRREKKGS